MKFQPKVVAPGRLRVSLRAAVLLFAFLVTAKVVGIGPVDDTYIFLRYAQHAAHGLGPVFNPGERVEGYTSPLWLAILVPLFFISQEPSTLVVALSAAAGFACVLLLASRRRFSGALLLATNPAFVFWSFSGMDAAVTALLLLAAFVAIVREGADTRPRLLAGATWLALAVLARPECAALVPLAAAWVALSGRTKRGHVGRDMVQFAGPFLIVGAYLLWRHAYFGLWLPNTYYAKMGASLEVRLASGERYAESMILNLFPLAGAYLLTTGNARRWVGIVALWWLAVVLWVGGDFFPYFRLFVPMLPIVMFGIGKVRPFRFVTWSGPHSLDLAAGLLVLVNVLSLVGPEHNLAKREVSVAREWANVGLALRSLVPRGATLATLVTGAIPYYSGLKTVDLLGLSDAHIGREGHVHARAFIGHQRYDTDYVLARAPDVIVLQDSGQFVAPRFAARGWPYYDGFELGYVYALADLVDRPETIRRYVYRAQRLPNGTFLEALWKR
jgi:arabinofuranosyltransferase